MRAGGLCRGMNRVYLSAKACQAGNCCELGRQARSQSREGCMEAWLQVYHVPCKGGLGPQQLPALLCILGQNSVQGVHSGNGCSMGGFMASLIAWAAHLHHVVQSTSNSVQCMLVLVQVPAWSDAGQVHPRRSCWKRANPIAHAAKVGESRDARQLQSLRC